MEGEKSILSAARNRGKSAIDLQRAAAQSSGDFFKEILPIMYDASIIDEARFLALMAGDVQSGLSTKELLELAIFWEVTPSASEFWKRHKSRDELIKSLQRRKEALDLAVRMKATAPVSAPTEAHTMTTLHPRRRDRKTSLGTLSKLFDQSDVDYPVSGDLFGTSGDYTDGIIYMARRFKMDNGNLAAMRTTHASGGDKQTTKQEGDTESSESVQLFVGLGTSPLSRGTHPTDLPPPVALSLDDSQQQSVDGLLLESETSTPAIHAESATVSAADEQLIAKGDNVIHMKGQDGHLHRLGSIRFKPDDYNLLAQVGGLQRNIQMQRVSEDGDEAEQHETQMRKLLSRGPSLVTGEDPNKAAAPPAVFDMDSFIAKYAAMDANDGADGQTISPLSSRPSSRLSPQNEGMKWHGDELHMQSSAVMPSPGFHSGRPFSASSENAAHTPGADAILPDKVSKLDLYFRPVRDADRVVIKMGSPRPSSPQSKSPRRRKSDALDQLVTRSSSNTPRASLMPAKSPTIKYNTTPILSPGSNGEEPLAFRHRLGGRAGRLARQISERLRGDISTADIHLVQEPEDVCASPDRGHAYMHDMKVDGDVPELFLPILHSEHSGEGMSHVLHTLVDGSRTRGKDAGGEGLSVDVQYDGIVRQVNRLHATKADSPRQHASHRTSQTLAHR